MCPLRCPALPRPTAPGTPLKETFLRDLGWVLSEHQRAGGAALSPGAAALAHALRGVALQQGWGALAAALAGAAASTPSVSAPTTPSSRAELLAASLSMDLLERLSQWSESAGSKDAACGAAGSAAGGAAGSAAGASAPASVPSGASSPLVLRKTPSQSFDLPAELSFTDLPEPEALEAAPAGQPALAAAGAEGEGDECRPSGSACGGRGGSGPGTELRAAGCAARASAAGSSSLELRPSALRPAHAASGASQGGNGDSGGGGGGGRRSESATELLARQLVREEIQRLEEEEVGGAALFGLSSI